MDGAGAERDEDFESLLEYLKESRGFDFTGYKRTSLMRRVRRRMSQIDITSFAEYADRLQVDAEEFAALFNIILINVTAFFRDPEAWDHLRTEVIPALVAKWSPDRPIRVWSAGCASGEEAYSLAMVLTEVLGPEEFRKRVKIYATDVDDDALGEARYASFDANGVAGVPPDMLERYFEQYNGRYLFRKDLRRTVIFGRNDLVQDAPISRIDLLVCRNTLMYLNAETQTKVLNRFHFALAPGGVLFLGRAEMLLSHSRLFDPFDLKRRIFRKTIETTTGLDRFVQGALMADRHTDVSGLGELRELALSTNPVAQVVVTGDDVVAVINQQAEALFDLSRRDIGRLLRDLELSYRPVELRAFVEQAKVERRVVRIKDVEWRRAGSDPAWFEVHVNPLVNNDNGLIGVSIAFHDVSAARVLLSDLEHANRQLEAAYEELQSTNEELETTNEELQSTVEELETTNEELQSTNEELETMNEELQSTNDELQVINETLRERTVELDDVNSFLAAILTSIRAGVVVIDADMRVLVWNRGAEDLWGLRAEEAKGVHLLSLDIGLSMTDLRPMVGSALVDPAFTTTVEMSAVNRRGRPIELRLTCSALRTAEGEATGALLLMDQRVDGRLDAELSPDGAL